MVGKSERVFQRWDFHQRLQHALLMLAVTLLVVTGMPLRFPDAGISHFLMALIGGASRAGVLHRFSAVVLIVCSGYHALYILVRLVRRDFIWSMMPQWKDVKDLWQMSMYFVGLSEFKPKFARYTFKEKAEYWAVAWGTVIMVGTGLVMWFPVGAAKVLKSYVPLAMDVARVVHSYEGLLAALAIVVWHFYNAHISAEVFPMSPVWLTGKIPEHQLMLEHALEYEELTGVKLPDDYHRLSPTELAKYAEPSPMEEAEMAPVPARIDRTDG